MKRFGVLGGTFNPIHIGHLAMAQMALERFDLDKVIFVPSNRPPHKKIANLASARDRFQMVRLAIKNNPSFAVSDFEIKRKGKSYTIETVKHLCSVYPQKTKFFFIIGGDSFPDLPSWKSIDEILRRASFIVVNRPGYAGGKGRIRHCSVTMPGIDISSSYIRRRVSRGKSVKYFVPENIFRYMDHHGLYQAS